MVNIFRNFLSLSDKEDIIKYVDSLNLKINLSNKHIVSVTNDLKGRSYMFDLTNTNISNYLSTFQSSNNVQDINILPNIFYRIMDDISEYISFSREHIFLQIVDMNGGGFVKPHYDTSIDGYVSFKCNIPVLSETYDLYVDKSEYSIGECDLYSFEASLYKHWTSQFLNRRILLSYCFGMKYEELGWKNSDPRIRLSQRIARYFQS